MRRSRLRASWLRQVEAYLNFNERRLKFFRLYVLYRSDICEFYCLVPDNNPDSSMDNTMLFAMSGDGKRDVTIPMVFLFSREGSTVLHALDTHKGLEVALTHTPIPQGEGDSKWRRVKNLDRT